MLLSVKCWWLAIVAVKAVMLGVHTASAPFFVLWNAPHSPVGKFRVDFPPFSKILPAIHHCTRECRFGKNRENFSNKFSLPPPVGLFEAQMTKKRLNFINCLHFLINKPRKRHYFALETKNFPSTMQWTRECRFAKKWETFFNFSFHW